MYYNNALKFISLRKASRFLEIVRNNPALLREVDFQGFTLLHYYLSSSISTPSDLKELIALGADVNKVSFNGVSPLFLVENFEHDIVNILKSNGAVTTCIEKGVSYLKNNDFHYFRKWIDENNFDPDSTYSTITQIKWTLTHGAVALGLYEYVKFLISKGANVNQINGNGNSILGLYEKFSDVKIYDLLIQHGAKLTKIEKANKICKDECYDEFVALANENIAVFININYGDSFLHGRNKKSQKIVRYLLLNGMSANILNKNLKTPLHSCGDSVIAKILIENGAELNALDDIGRTPLHDAVLKSDADLIGYLLNLGCDNNIKDNFGDTAYDIAISSQILDQKVTESLK